MIVVVDKWQCYLPKNYIFYWLQVWDPACYGKESTFMWYIWHKVVMVNVGRPYIAPSSLSKQFVFFLLNVSEPVKYKIWDCIQAQRIWQWATFIMHELCGVQIDNFDHFRSKQTIFGRGFLRSLLKNQDLVRSPRHHSLDYLD